MALTDIELGAVPGPKTGINGTPLDPELDNMGAAHRANIHALRAEAMQILDRDRSDLDDMIARLKSRPPVMSFADRPAIRPQT